MSAGWFIYVHAFLRGFIFVLTVCLSSICENDILVSSELGFLILASFISCHRCMKWYQGCRMEL